ncbi:MAG: hypothetical protein QRY72_04465 [Candidatus Rhabdochlamydia sp.]
MTTSTSIALNTFLHRISSQERSQLLGFLSAPFREQVEQAAKIYPVSLLEKEDSFDLISWVHSSWIAPVLRRFSESEIACFLSCLPPEKREDVAQELLFASPFLELSSLGKTFIVSQLFTALQEDAVDLLPPSFLPHASLNALLALSYLDLVQVIDLLGIRDLGAELKLIIDKQKLIKIHAVLSKQQNHYLKVISQKKEPITFASMNLVNWTGDSDNLKFLIRQRGANRLAKALYKEHSSLKWYVLRRFDQETAHLIDKLSTSMDNPYIAQTLSLQTLELIHHLRESYE